MVEINSEDAKAIYELSKVTSVSKQIMDDFLHSVVMAIFKDYVTSFKNPNTALLNYMAAWEQNIIAQKKDELELLTSHQESMSDMVVGQKLVDQDSLDDYVSEVNTVKEIITEAVDFSYQDYINAGGNPILYISIFQSIMESRDALLEKIKNILVK